MLNEVKAISRGLYCVCDDRSGAFNPPFIAANDSVAQRAFVDAALNTRGVFHDHPEDFSLFKVGKFYELTGVVDPQTPLRLMCGTELKLALSSSEANSFGEFVSGGDDDSEFVADDDGDAA